MKQEIDKYQKNKQIMIASKIENNELSPSINLKQLVSNFNQASAQARVRFQGFAVKDDVISTNLIAMNALPGRDAAESILEMMKLYDKSAGKTNFALEPILSISGTPQNRTTPINFKIVPIAPTGEASTGSGTTQQK